MSELPSSPRASRFLLWRRLTVILPGMLIVLFATAAGHGATLTVATDPEKRGGPLVELSAAALARSGHTMDIRYLPWKRALAKSLAGEFDMLLGAYYNAERAERLAYSSPIGTVELCLAARKDSGLRLASLADLEPLRIGHIRGATVSPEFDRLLPRLRVEYVAHYEHNIRKLLHGRIDVLIDKRHMLVTTLREKYREDADRVEILEPPLQVLFFHNAFPLARPQHRDLLQDFNQGLTLIESDGTLAAINRRHGIDQP